MGKKDGKASALFVLESDSASAQSLWVGYANGDISVFPLADAAAGEPPPAAALKATATWGAHGGGVNCLHGARGHAAVWSGGADWQAKQWGPAGDLLRSLTEHTLPVLPPPPPPRRSAPGEAGRHPPGISSAPFLPGGRGGAVVLDSP